MTSNVTTSTRAPIEMAISWLSRLRLPPFLIVGIIAVGLTLIAGLIAVYESRAYYEIAPYHYDSASYRVSAIRSHDLFMAQGRQAALLAALRGKDGLDVTLRLILAPELLLHRYGHLAVLLPYMAFFVALTLWYVFKRTDSWLPAIATVLFLFASPLIYDPYDGIADYWKDNLATWLLASAVVSWLLSDRLARRRWAVVCSLFLGMLVMQRSSAAVYGAALFLPLFLWAAITRFRVDGWRAATQRLVVFVAPALIFCAIVVSAQLDLLYTYYFVAGYGYTNPLAVAQFLLGGVPSQIGVAVALPIIYVICLSCLPTWRQLHRDTLIVAALVAALPLLVILSNALYFGFFAVWLPLLIVLLATLMPRSARLAQPLAAALMVGAVCLSAVQFGVTHDRSRILAATNAAQRTFLIQLVDLLHTRSGSAGYQLLFDETPGPLYNQAFFTRGIRLAQPVGLVSVHDTYYRAAFGDQSSEQVAALNMAALELRPGAVVVTTCRVENLQNNPLFKPFALQVVLAMARHVEASAHWKAVQQLDSPYGCLYAYQYVEQAQDPVAKWQDLAESHTRVDIPVTLATAPSVRLFDYWSRYPPEQFNGVTYQWMPAGASGLNIRLFVAAPHKVIFRAGVTPGPARSDAVRTLIIRYGDQQVTTQVQGESSIAVPIALEAGITDINIAVQEEADTPPVAGGDSRELMALLISPHLISADD